jgi:hypothetical protein
LVRICKDLLRKINSIYSGFGTVFFIPSFIIKVVFVLTFTSAIDAPGGFLFEWWSVFWDIFIARTNEKHSEAAASYIGVGLPVLINVSFSVGVGKVVAMKVSRRFANHFCYSKWILGIEIQFVHLKEKISMKDVLLIDAFNSLPPPKKKRKKRKKRFSFCTECWIFSEIVFIGLNILLPTLIKPQCDGPK